MKNPFTIIGIVVGLVPSLIGGALAGTAPAFSFMIVNYGSGLCLEPSGSGLGDPILQQPCDSNRPAQIWGASGATATQYLISNKVHATHCLDVRDGVNADRPSSSSGPATYKPTP